MTGTLSGVFVFFGGGGGGGGGGATLEDKRSGNRNASSACESLCYY